MAEFLKTHDLKTLQQMTDKKAHSGNNGKIFAGKNDYGTNRSTEENQHFPEILGQSGKGKEAGRTLAEAADDTRRVQGNNGEQKGFPKEKFLAYLEVRARQNGTWIENISTITSVKSSLNPCCIGTCSMRHLAANEGRERHPNCVRARFLVERADFHRPQI